MSGLRLPSMDLALRAAGAAALTLMVLLSGCSKKSSVLKSGSRPIERFSC